MFLEDAATTTNVVLSDHEYFLLLTGALVPLLVYILHRYIEPGIRKVWANVFPNDTALVDSATETTKGFIQVAGAAIGGYLYNGIITTVGFDLTSIDVWRGALNAAVAALFAHNLLWKPTGVNVILNNNQRDPAARVQSEDKIPVHHRTAPEAG